MTNQEKANFLLQQLNYDDEIKAKYGKYLLDNSLLFGDKRANNFEAYKASYRLVVRINSLDELEAVKPLINQPVSKEQVIKSATKEFCTSDYRIDIRNTAIQGMHTYSTLSIFFALEDIEVQIEIPCRLLLDSEFSEFIKEGKRKVYDTEMHYFTGYSRAQIARMMVLCYRFTTSDIIGWYGGNQTLKDQEIISEIISLLK